MFSLNKNVMSRVEHLIQNSEALRCAVSTLNNGTTLIDVGLHVPGSYEAARLFAEIDMAGLGSCSYSHFPLTPSIGVQTVEVTIDQPVLACIYSMMGGLKINEGEFAIIGSGPGRALALAKDDPFIKNAEFQEQSDTAVVCLQTPSMPDEAVAQTIADKCHVNAKKLILLAHNNSSLAASVQISARIAEQAMNKMLKLDFDLNTVIHASGWCVVAPVIYDELEAMGRVNDCLLYGGVAEFMVDTEDEKIEKVIDLLVTQASPDYGRPFAQLYREAGFNFHKMDKHIHSPAKVQIFNMRTGKMYSSGAVDTDRLVKSLFITREE